MRQFFVIATLLMAMLGLKSMGLEVQSGGFEPLFLAALGFVILSAFSSAEIVEKFNLPKVTGFILAGVILGPQVSNILSDQIVTDTKMFTTLALGLIALSAGLELHLSSLKKIAKTLGFIVLFKFLFLFTIVLFGFYFALQNLYLPVDLTNPQMFALSLIFSALAVGTSPSISLAIINESKIKSRMADLTLGMAVVKDVLVVLTLAVCLTLSKTLVDPSLEMSSDVLFGLGQEILFSILAGSALGGLLILYLRFIKLEMLLFVTLVIIGMAEISSLLHLELLLVFIAAGFVVANFSKYEHDLLTPIEKVSLPVFIIFFTNIGAALDLQAIEKILPIAIVLFALRIGAFYFASLLGTRLGHEDPKIVKNSWLCFIPQAGVTLGLVGIAAQQLPEMSSLIENIGMGLVGLNLLVGPVTLRMGLNNSQDLKEKKIEPVKEALGFGVSDKIMEYSTTYLDKRKSYFSFFIENSFVAPTVQLLNNFELDKNNGPHTLISNMDLFEKLTNQMSQKTQELIILRQANLESFSELPQVVEDELGKQWLIVKPTDSIKIRFKKRFLKFKKTMGFKLVKATLLRACFRKYLYLHYIQSERAIIENWMKTLFSINNYFENYINDGINYEEFLSRCTLKIQKFSNLVSEHYSDDLNVEFKRILIALEKSGSPYSNEKKLSFSKYSQQILIVEEKVNRSIKIWQKIFSGYRNQMIIKNKLNSIQKVTASQIHGKVSQPVQEFIDYSIPVILKSKNKMSEVLKLFEKKNTSIEEISLQIKDARDQLDPIRVMVERVIEHGFEKYVFSAISKLSHMDQNYKILTPQFMLAPDPAKAEFKFINLSETVMLQIEGKLIPELHQLASVLHQSLMKQIYQYLEIYDRMILRSEGFDAIKGVEVDEYIVDFKEDYKHIEDYSLQLQKKLSSSLEKFQSNKMQLLNEIFNDFDSLESREIYYKQTNSRILKIYRKSTLKVKKFVNLAQEKIERASEKLRFAKNEFKDSEITKQLKSKVKEGKVDSATIRKYLTFIYRQPFLEDIPQTYRRLFTLNELYDERFFTNDEIVRELNQENLETNKYLIIGESGSGKSTMLNVLAKKYNHELIEIRRNVYLKQISIFESLASILNCNKDIKSLLRVLNQKKRTILIDDFNIWWRPNQISDLDQFFELLTKTSENTTWLVSIGQLGFTRLKQTFHFSSYFDELIFLNKIDKSKTLDFIKKRHRYSGRELHFPETFSNRYLKNIAVKGNKNLFLQYIYELSAGNPRLLCFLWLRSISVFTSKDVRTTFKNVEIGNFNFIEALSESKKVILMEITSFQSRSFQDLTENLAYDSDLIKKDLDFLERSLLVEFSRGCYTVPPLIDVGVEHYLRGANYGI